MTFEPARSRRARSAAGTAAVAVALVAGPLAGCDASAPEAERQPAAASSVAASRSPDTSLDERAAPSPGPRPLDLPAVPARPPSRFASQLDRADAVLRDRGADPGDVRVAARFAQVAARTLATRPPAYRRSVLRRLDPAARAKARADTDAAAALQALAAPQPRLPDDWRIVTPPPPAQLQRYYRRAERLTGVSWTYLAAIHLVESRMGRIRATSSAGARGPMQFLPSTWDIYGRGGDINDPRDAILAAGRLLEANGARGSIAGAVVRYNNSESYVRAVLGYARQMQRSPMAYRGYWHWQVLYRHVRGTYLMPEGYPARRATLLAR